MANKYDDKHKFMKAIKDLYNAVFWAEGTITTKIQPHHMNETGGLTVMHVGFDVLMSDEQRDAFVKWVREDRPGVDKAGN